MRVRKMHGKPVKSSIIWIFCIGRKKKLLCHCFLMKRRAGKGKIDQDLPKCRPKRLKPSNLFSDPDRVLIRKPDDHGGENRYTFGLEILIKLRNVFSLKLVIPRAHAFECCPDDVKPHLGNLIRGKPG